MTAPLHRGFYARTVLEVARELLGCHLVTDREPGRVVLRITEVEAYAGADDPASHAYRGRTARNAAMFGPPGHAYVYFTYGMHWCLNIVAAPDGEPAAVLVRAGAVVDGIDVARSRRTPGKERDLARGPARLAQALEVTGEHNGADLTSRDGGLHLQRGSRPTDGEISAGPRIGIRRAADVPWRLWITGEPTVSTYRPAAPARLRPAR